MLIKIKYNNSSINTVALKHNAKQYAYVYFMRFATWFDGLQKTGHIINY